MIYCFSYQQIDEQYGVNLTQLLDPGDYRALRDPDTQFCNIMQIFRTCLTIVEGAVGVALLATCIASGLRAILETMATSIKTLAQSPFGLLLVTLVIVADLILGYFEQRELLNRMSELDGVIATFEPATRAYTAKIYQASAMIALLVRN